MSRVVYLEGEYVLDKGTKIIVENNSKVEIGEGVKIGADIKILARGNSTVIIDGNTYIGKGSLIQSNENSELFLNNCKLGRYVEIFLIAHSKTTVEDNTLVQSFGEICAVNGIITINKNATFGTHLEMRCHYTEIIIGEDDQFAQYDKVIAGDGHKFYDKNTNELLTHDEKVIVGDHVWVGVGATLLSKCNIGKGSIVGANSLINREFPGEVVIAGNPARIIREGVYWER